MKRRKKKRWHWYQFWFYCVRPSFLDTHTRQIKHENFQNRYKLFPPKKKKTSSLSSLSLSSNKFILHANFATFYAEHHFVVWIMIFIWEKKKCRRKWTQSKSIGCFGWAQSCLFRISTRTPILLALAKCTATHT